MLNSNVKLTALVFVLVLSGCSSLVRVLPGDDNYSQPSRSEWSEKKSGSEEVCTAVRDRYYQATSGDMDVLESCKHPRGFVDLSCYIVPFAILDFPFSLITDTIIFPYTFISNNTYNSVFRTKNGDVCRIDAMDSLGKPEGADL